MDLDLGEGEPRRTENVRSGGGDGSRGSSGSDWPRWPLFAVSAVLAGLALLTGWAWLTLFALGTLLAGLTVNAWSTRRVRPRRASRTGIAVNARRADVALIALRSRLSNPVYTGSPRRALRSSRTGRPLRSWDTDPDALPRPRRARSDDAVGDGPGEGEDR